jgi:hypothetical protein
MWLHKTQRRVAPIRGRGQDAAHQITVFHRMLNPRSDNSLKNCATLEKKHPQTRLSPGGVFVIGSPPRKAHFSDAVEAEGGCPGVCGTSDRSSKLGVDYKAKSFVNLPLGESHKQLTGS